MSIRSLKMERVSSQCRFSQVLQFNTHGPLALHFKASRKKKTEGPFHLHYKDLHGSL